MNQGSIAVALEGKRKILLVFPLYTCDGLYFTDIASIWSMHSHRYRDYTNHKTAIARSAFPISRLNPMEGIIPFLLSAALCGCLVQGSFLILYPDLRRSAALGPITHCLYQKRDFEPILQRFVRSMQQYCGSCPTRCPQGRGPVITICYIDVCMLKSVQNMFNAVFKWREAARWIGTRSNLSFTSIAASASTKAPTPLLFPALHVRTAMM